MVYLNAPVLFWHKVLWLQAVYQSQRRLLQQKKCRLWWGKIFILWARKGPCATMIYGSLYMNNTFHVSWQQCGNNRDCPVCPLRGLPAGRAGTKWGCAFGTWGSEMELVIKVWKQTVPNNGSVVSLQKTLGNRQFGEVTARKRIDYVWGVFSRGIVRGLFFRFKHVSKYIEWISLGKFHLHCSFSKELWSDSDTHYDN